MSHFTPLSALLGGVLIALSAVLLLALNGRIAGVSGVAGGLWFSPPGERAWRLLFLLGLVLGTALQVALGGQVPLPRVGFPTAAVVVAGLLVGYGTALSGGCTSGHGVCGLARFSLRSLAATLTFLVVGIATTYVVRHVLHLGA
jgi:uncharacterized membrane protein YedE/YeeE